MADHKSSAEPFEATTKNILYWDFFGPSAPHTAAHFKKHLADFLRENSLRVSSIELKSEQEFHMAVVCPFDDPTAARAVANTLRAARRSTFTDQRD